MARVVPFREVQRYSSSLVLVVWEGLCGCDVGGVTCTADGRVGGALTPGTELGWKPIVTHQGGQR